jgi:DNA-binding response OmpR family regulator
LLLKGHQVISAHSKAAALRLVANEQFDLILLDYNLPDGTGFGVCLFIRRIDKKTPIIFSTIYK